MYAVDNYAAVRRFVFVEGKSRREAARVFGLSRDTISKMCQFSAPPGYVRKKPPARPKLGLSRANLDEESGNQGEDERIAERLDDRRWRCDSQGFLLCGVTWSVTPPLF